MNRMIAYTLLLSLATQVGAAESCDPKGQKVEQVMADKVAAYDDAGNFTEDLPKSAILIGSDIVECKVTPKHVKVRLADKRTVWVDRLEVKISGARPAPARICKDEAISRNKGTTTPATSGIDPCSGG